ncbi:MAG: lytic polysaccharide monooxygenase [Gammaproteobacteria bacterium]|nr:lytic polysaccharide monooxygenase [Gammaproteobacteria bacterium]MBU2057757.1 lytic polysaccharide monooxygenase [Gammaproteobacteria bacterium]MBU2174703.1 lytic polysaccharide monooxygenase [Gammaproteobacteria bacterium]MBU2248960.1 lytic polysaccharide monooxygenase [Gammaproteobacteria bacterium]MBU2345188.1 lytic polysaccharide monooxygenase [Gammaproteobacteria bacterium]
MKTSQLFTGTLSLLALLCSFHSQAHGYVEYPKARQQICKEDGGYWWPADGSGIPNLACRAAFVQSGEYPLSQHHEFSSNVANYQDINAVKAKLTTGLLCAGGDSRKAGMDAPSAHWHYSTIDVSQQNSLQLKFKATTPHNPSYWQVYLSSADYDPATELLNWDKLQLIHQQADITAQAGYYLLNISLPADRQGKAVLYTRWQREDAAGEGFYNCSDLLLVNSNTDPDPEPVWFDKGAYLTSGQTGSAGETAVLRVFDSSGQELMEQSLLISQTTAINQQWALDLAQLVNTQYSTLLQIGLQQNALITVQPTPAQNRFYLRNTTHFVNLDLKPAETTTPGCAGLDPAQIFAYPNWPQKDWSGQPSHASEGDHLSYQNKVYRANWWTQSIPGSDSSWTLICSI